MRATTLATLAAILSAASPACAQSTPELLYDLDRSSLSAILGDANFAIVRDDEEELIISAGIGAPDLHIALSRCEAQRKCEQLRIRAYWPIGQRSSARSAAENYDRSVPVAFVTVVENDEQSVVAAGRDIWLAPGVTKQNIIAQLEFSSQVAIAMTESLKAADPGLEAFWETQNVD